MKRCYEVNLKIPSQLEINQNYLTIKKVRLLTNNPHRIEFLRNNRIDVTHVPIEKEMDPWVSEELHFKKEKLKHLLKCEGFKDEFLKKYNLNDVKRGEENES